MMDNKQAIFMLQDGALAGEIKDYLVKQERCEEVMVDNEKFPGEYFSKKEL
jgi:hypothetical protein